MIKGDSPCGWDKTLHYLICLEACDLDWYRSRKNLEQLWWQRATFDLSMRRNKYKVGTIQLWSIFYSFNRHLLGLLWTKFCSVHSYLINVNLSSLEARAGWEAKQTKMSIDPWFGEWLPVLVRQLDQMSPVVLHSAEFQWSILNKH